MTTPLQIALEGVLEDIHGTPAPSAAGSLELAAVLVVLQDLHGASADPQAWPQLQVVLTRRRAELRRHAGEISCPGGRWEASDGSLYDTAVREAEEEIGLPRRRVIAAGALPVVLTFVTNYAVYPFVALAADEAAGTAAHSSEVADASQRWQISTEEVDAVIELSLQTLRDGRTRARIERHGASFETDTFTVGEHVIWGATYRILDDLLVRLQQIA
jgi:8-oxo-dGTP pyrophosphatase MutT (NUDIX family)